MGTYYAVSFVRVNKEAVINLIRWTKSIIFRSSPDSEGGASGKYIKCGEAVLKTEYEITFFVTALVK